MVHSYDLGTFFSPNLLFFVVCCCCRCCVLLTSWPTAVAYLLDFSVSSHIPLAKCGQWNRRGRKQVLWNNSWYLHAIQMALWAVPWRFQVGQVYHLSCCSICTWQFAWSKWRVRGLFVISMLWPPPPRPGLSNTASQKTLCCAISGQLYCTACRLSHGAYIWFT